MPSKCIEICREEASILLRQIGHNQLARTFGIHEYLLLPTKHKFKKNSYVFQTKLITKLPLYGMLCFNVVGC